MTGYALIALGLIVFACLLGSRLFHRWPYQHPDCYPMRAMDNRERRAAWAVKHYLQNDAMPNTFFHFPVKNRLGLDPLANGKAL